MNTALVDTYWEIGKMIVEAQGGVERDSYCDELLKRISAKLTKEFGKGFDTSNLRYMRQFFVAFPNCDSLRHNLSWTHYKKLIKVSNPKAREYYANEAVEGNWSTRQLERQIATQYYERRLSTQRDEADKKVLIKKIFQLSPIHSTRPLLYMTPSSLNFRCKI